MNLLIPDQNWLFPALRTLQLHFWAPLCSLTYRVSCAGSIPKWSDCRRQLSRSDTWIPSSWECMWWCQSSAGISIPNCLDTRLANNRASEGRGKVYFDYAERRRLKPQVNPVASPSRRSCEDIGPFASQKLHHPSLASRMQRQSSQGTPSSTGWSSLVTAHTLLRVHWAYRATWGPLWPLSPWTWRRTFSLSASWCEVIVF